MCELLSSFFVMGAVMINNEAVAVEIFNDGEVEVFIVPVQQYSKCYSDSISDLEPYTAVKF